MPTPDTKQDFIDAGFTVTGGSTENAPLTFLQTNYPHIIQDGEVKLDELKTALGLPIDEKVNGYGLNFIGRNVAKAKYAQETQKVIKINAKQSKNFDTTGNLVLRGDNLDSLKILKNYYSGKIKMIYIDPPYNTESDNFVYPDKFNKEEAEVLRLANISDDDVERLGFSFGNKKSHNGWLAFMYPRLRLARELLSKDGVIFISIDDNEQANLKLLCDEIFGEGNFVATLIWKSKSGGANDSLFFAIDHEYILCYAKHSASFDLLIDPEASVTTTYNHQDEKGKYMLRRLDQTSLGYQPSLDFPITASDGKVYRVKHKNPAQKVARWRWGKNTVAERFDELVFKDGYVYTKFYEKKGSIARSILIDERFGRTRTGKTILAEIMQVQIFDNPKPHKLIQFLCNVTLSGEESAVILDFFAGSGTTGHAVMQLNAEDGGNRRFILCQMDEPIEKKHAAYEFCTKHKLPPVISSITIERLNRAGEKIRSSHAPHAKTADIGYKVLELTDAPRLKADDDRAVTFIDNENLTAQDRLISLMLRVGVDDPTVIPEEIVKDSLYRIANRYYIVHSVKLDGEKNRMKLKEALIHGEYIYVDGWTATLNTTLHDLRGKGKEKMQIVY